MLAYAGSRGLTEESIGRFGLGYAPPSWDALALAARKKGFSETELVTAGLAARSDKSRGCYDRFRDRLMFPIRDVNGRVIGFGGRAMDKEERAKYINSPESPLFDKSSQLYVMDLSRKAIVSSGQAVVVEGYLDALMPLQLGMDNVVATLGTALTDRQVRLLSRYAQEVVLVFDADAAGVIAAERAIEVFLAQKVHVRVASIPTGKDPCDFCLAEGVSALQGLVAGAPDALQYAWNRLQGGLSDGEGTPADQRRAMEKFLSLVASSSAYGAIDEMRLGQLAQHIGQMLNVAPEYLQKEIRRLSRQIRRRGPADQEDGPRRQGSRAVAAGEPAPLAESAERHVLEVLLNRGDLFDQAAERISPEDFRVADLRAIAERLWQMDIAGTIALEDLLVTEQLSSHAELITELAIAGEHRGNFEQTLLGALEDMLYRRDQRETQELKASGLSDEKLRQLGRRFGRPDARRMPGIV